MGQANGQQSYQQPGYFSRRPMGNPMSGYPQYGQPGYGQQGYGQPWMQGSGQPYAPPMNFSNFQPQQLAQGMGNLMGQYQPPAGMGMTNTAPIGLPQAQSQPRPMGYPLPPPQPTPSPDFGPSYGGAFPSTGQSAVSAQGAADMAMQDYASPQYAAYYNSQPASTRAFLHAPGNARLGNYLGQQAGQSFNEFNGMQDPFAFALKGY